MTGNLNECFDLMTKKELENLKTITDEGQTRCD